MRERIEKITIPDEHVQDWMQTLREGHFTDEEIDSIISHLNSTYSGIKNKEKINKAIEDTKDSLINRLGRELTDEEMKILREVIEEKFNT